MIIILEDKEVSLTWDEFVSAAGYVMTDRENVGRDVTSAEKPGTRKDGLSNRQAARPGRELLAFLAKLYENGTKGASGKELSNQIVIDTCFNLAPQAPYKEIGDFLQTKGFIFDKIKERLTTRHFFTQPVVLLAYYLAQAKPAQVKDIWPLDRDDLALVFSDLGKKFED